MIVKAQYKNSCPLLKSKKKEKASDEMRKSMKENSLPFWWNTRE